MMFNISLQLMNHTELRVDGNISAVEHSQDMSSLLLHDELIAQQENYNSEDAARIEGSDNDA